MNHHETQIKVANLGQEKNKQEQQDADREWWWIGFVFILRDIFEKVRCDLANFFSFKSKLCNATSQTFAPSQMLPPLDSPFKSFNFLWGEKTSLNVNL